ncbi:MAG TPA: hypothetical protein VLA68_01805, partial [Nitrososphaera sp.]|nr:hypothetical protein [Nitrososphaera sp.]
MSRSKQMARSRGIRSSRQMDQDTKVALQLQQAADAIRELIRSARVSVEEKVSLEDQINNLARETDYMLDGMDA